MTRRAFLRSVLVVSLLPGRPAEARQQPPRLIADNRTPYVVDVYAWNGATWGFVSRLGPGTWMAFPNAANGSYWRAVFGQAYRDHRVNYVWDPYYNGYQDVFLIR